MDVVAAGVAQAGQGVILRENAHAGSLSGFQHRPEAGGIAQVGVLHLIARLAEQIHDFLAGAELLVGQLGVGVQVVAEGHSQRAAPGNRVLNTGQHVLHGRGNLQISDN